MPRATILLELVMTLSATAESEAEVVAMVVSLANSGRMTLCGTFSGARFDPAELGIPAGWAG